MAVGTVAKDPNETAWVTMDWTRRLTSGITISTSAWSIPSGVTSSTDVVVSGNLKTSILIAGGTAGQDYECVNTVTTSDGQTLQRTGILAVRDL